MTPLPDKIYISPEDYLAMEAVSPVKHEYLNGEIFQMSGASFAHNLVSANTASELHGKLKNTNCAVVQGDMRVLIEATGLFTYPDIAVVCGKPDLKKINGLDNLLNLILIVEVLSPSTEAFDKGDKFDHYRTIDSVKEYILVWQDKRRVARYRRQDDESWLLTDFIGGDAVIELTSVNCVLTMEEIYAKVVFEEDAGE